ncbi:MAG: hypothetical protein AB7I30_12170, partial [Isosphaeraceae bacterium]
MLRARHRRFSLGQNQGPTRPDVMTRYAPLLEGLERRELLATLVVKTIPGVGEFGSITAAVAAASPNDTVLVHPGTYNENNILVNKALTITSVAGAGSTIVNGGAGATPQAGIFRVINTTGTVTIGGLNAGFT